MQCAGVKAAGTDSDKGLPWGVGLTEFVAPPASDGTAIA